MSRLDDWLKRHGATRITERWDVDGVANRVRGVIGLARLLLRRSPSSSSSEGDTRENGDEHMSSVNDTEGHHST